MKNFLARNLSLGFLCTCTLLNVYAQEQKVNIAAKTAGAQAATDAPFSYQREVLASSNTPDKAIDGDKSSRESRWISEQSKTPHYLEVTFAKSYQVSQVIAYPDYPASTHKYGVDYKLQYWDGTEWKDMSVEKSEISSTVLKFDIKPIETNKIRFYAIKTDGAGFVKLFEIEAYAGN